MQAILEQHLEIDDAIRGGKPCLACTRIAVSDVAMMHLRLGQSLEQIAGHYDVSLAALHAAMTYTTIKPTSIERCGRTRLSFRRRRKKGHPCSRPSSGRCVVSDRIRFHLDEHIDPDIAAALRRHGNAR